jgi:hypothetical protein
VTHRVSSCRPLVVGTGDIHRGGVGLSRFGGFGPLRWPVEDVGASLRLAAKIIDAPDLNAVCHRSTRVLDRHDVLQRGLGGVVPTNS